MSNFDHILEINHITHNMTRIKTTPDISLADKISDTVAGIVGSWPFVITQSILIIIWCAVNSGILGGIPKWDPYPFLFLNIALSFQAAYTAPIIMMSQNRVESRDRQRAEAGYEVNLIAEKGIESVRNQLEFIQNHLTKNMTVKEDLKNVEIQLEILKKSIEKLNK
jgi:uncharacterized membrane protein